MILGVAAVGVFYLAIASRSTRVVAIPLSAQFGLFQLLPPAYWAGLGFIGLSVFFSWRTDSDVLFVATGTLLLAVLAGTPGMFESNPRYWDVYLHFGEAQGILATGHLPAPGLGQYSASWPGSFLIMASFAATSGSPSMFLVAAYPFVSGALTFVALFAFLRATFPRPVVAPGAVLASLFAVWAQYHVSPQSLGFVMALLVLTVLWRREDRWRLVGGLLFVGLVVSHPTSTLLLLSVLVSMSVLGLLGRRKTADTRRDVRSICLVTSVYAATWLAWLIFHATESSKVAQTAIINRIGGLISLPESTVNLATARTGANLFSLAPHLRLASLGVYGLFGLLALFLVRRQKENRRLAHFLFSAIVGLGVVGAADILGFGGQFYDRSLLLFATFAPALCLTGFRTVRLPKAVRRSIGVVLLGASLVAASTAYYQEAFNYVADRSVAVSQFLQDAPPQSPVLDGMFPNPIWLDPNQRTPIVRAGFDVMYPHPTRDYLGPVTGYAVFDPTARLWYLQWRDIHVYEFYEHEQVNRSLIYDNGYGTIYLEEG